MSSAESGWRKRTQNYVEGLQDRICAALEAVDGQARFAEDRWTRPGGGGGKTRIIADGAAIEKGGVNTSAVWGELPAAQLAKMGPGPAEFFATGVSLVIHPRNPRAPTVHANFRYFERGDAYWFGGGADLTPYYPVLSDVQHFHRTLKAACDAHGADKYPEYKAWCDRYFFIKHRNETRGVGGLFYDNLTGDRDARFAMMQSLGDAFVPAYVPILERRKGDAFGEREREFQLVRRGRYVEFNLVYDKGTTFGLDTGGRTESILMSLPPLVKLVYDHKPEPGSEEERLTDFLQPRDWLAEP